MGVASMPVKSLGDIFGTSLHRAILKARGYTKVGRTFRCERQDFTEMLMIQGSSWNSGVEPWEFYIDVLVAFPDIPLRPTIRGANYHAKGRIDAIVADAPPSFQLRANDLDRLVVEVGQLATEASIRLPELLRPIQARARQGLFSPIPLPDSWL